MIGETRGDGMIKFSKDEFIEELTAEIEGYEEITGEQKKAFIEKVSSAIDSSSEKNKRISKHANSITIQLEDESELFDMVDQYYAAIMNEELDLYWADWKF